MGQTPSTYPRQQPRQQPRIVATRGSNPSDMRLLDRFLHTVANPPDRNGSRRDNTGSHPTSTGRPPPLTENDHKNVINLPVPPNYTQHSIHFENIHLGSSSTTVHVIFQKDDVKFYETPTSALADISGDTPEEDETKTCTICYERKKRYLIVPCGHYCLCGTCANLMKECPICCGSIEKFQLVYDS